ncbi:MULTISPECIES: carbon storage regulator [unclassified Bacillus (in: firmicutes)]|uniref:carbon storage regulator n=1 Tax=unclassified Bacillus (in: firmicutes) TaxID=185979 RepID=UPI001BE971B5|nr:MULTISPECIES: carbon storage regulator [unclassified Bacillus (in: firmicutes)]MBT2614109.1 carbon storage regulator [Bacillus sp. ISL-78]MBT2629380.1 carbon storage regulator [Bacillus sp. ISL-101]
MGLVVTRKMEQSLVIINEETNEKIEITLFRHELKGDIRMKIDAPKKYNILREEVIPE